ncbi:MAG: SdpI family protein [bacterium]
MNNESRLNLKPIVYVGFIAITLMFILSAYGWLHVPADQRIPVHWGINGQPDRYGSKFEGLLSIPLVSCILFALFLAIPWLEPRRMNLERSQKAYKAIIIGLFLFMLVLQGTMVFSALGYPFGMSQIVPTGVGLLFLLIGNYMGKMRSNFFMGIRTPWTLSSDLSWNKTHRLGGKLFAGFGVLMMILPWLVDGSVLFGFLIAGIVIVALVPIVYSYVVWKSDPDKQTAGR